MADSKLNRPIVVGVDGSEHSLRAADWAADEAIRQGCALRLVHAHQPLVVGVPDRWALTDEAQRVLDDARSRVAARQPGLAVSTMLREGPVPRELVEASTYARLLVVGREGLGRVHEVVLGSTSLACAAHTRVPLVVVPPGWRPAEQLHGRVVVGVDGSARCQAALGYAFDVAADRGARLVAVYAWYLPTRWPEAWPIHDYEARFETDATEVLRRSLDAWQQKYPGVAVTKAVELEHPAVALERHAADADLVVVGGRGHGLVTGMVLGSVAHAVLRHSSCPVTVVHEPGDRGSYRR